MATTPEAARWQRLAALFDTLVELPAAERHRRLAALGEADPALASELARMLEGDAADGILDHTLPQPVPEHVPVADRSGERVGPYRLLRQVGRGGMGEVYLAERADGDFRQRVALKLIKRGMDSEALLQRFARERRILAQLEHPHIARLLDGGMDADGTSFLAMEFVDGTSITEHARDAALGSRGRVELLLQAALAVAHAQSRLVVHRDLKPSNILVGSDGRVRVLDFGIATLLDDSEEKLTGTGVRVMSPAYAAPEQVRGEAVTTATDVYALGGVLFELLTGREPHPQRGAAPGAWLAALQQEGAERPSAVVRRGRSGESGRSRGDTAPERLARELRGDLDTIVLTALHADPARRYAGAAQLAQDLQRWLDGRPIAARPDTAGYRLRKFVARHRLGVGSASAVLLALIAGLGLALWQASIAREHAARADAAARRAELVKAFVLSLYAEQDPIARAAAQARTPAELVAAGLARARQQFAADPPLLSDVLADLASVQVGLGAAAAAEPVLSEVLAERRQRLGEADPATARAQLELAAAELGLERHASARDRLLAARPVLEARGTGLDLARADHLLARAVQQTDGSAAALPHVQRAHQALVRLRGAEHPDTVAVLGNVAVVLEGADRLDEAAAAFAQVTQLLERELGPDHARLVAPLATHSDILRRQRRYDEALPLLDRSVAIARAQLPARHPMLGHALSRLGDLRRRMGDYPGALAALDEAATCFPADAPQQGQIALFRGGVARARGDHAAAAAAMGEAHRRFLAALGPDNLFPWWAAVQHGVALTENGQLDEAERVLAEALRRLEVVSGPESMDVADALGGLAALRVAQQRPADAVPLLERAIAIRTTLFGAEDAGTVELQQRLDALRRGRDPGP